jgi:predicted short-subunit dehydrogenase-like oxidoreductase (DUF2520 family)
MVDADRVSYLFECHGATPIGSTETRPVPRMRGLDRQMDLTTALTVPAEARLLFRVAVVGAGRLGTALSAAFASAGIDVEGPLTRDQLPSPRATAVLLCVPDAQIQTAAAALASGRLVGHCSAATTFAPLARHEAFSLHPLMTVTHESADFAGATAAIAGGTTRARDTGRLLARAIGMRPVEIADADRGAYHAAASIASNFLVTIEDLAGRLAESAGLGREPLLALVRASVENWATQGAAQALTGPIARGDEETVARQRAAVAERAPEELDLFDALAAATRRLAAQRMVAA